MDTVLSNPYAIYIDLYRVPYSYTMFALGGGGMP